VHLGLRGGGVGGSVAIGALVYLPLNASSSSLGFELCPAREKNSHLIRNPRIRGGARWRGRPMREGLCLYAHPGDVFVRQRASTGLLNPSQKFDLNGRLDGPAAADLIRPQAGAARYLPVLRDQPPVRIDTRRRLGFRHTKKVPVRRKKFAVTRSTAIAPPEIENRGSERRCRGLGLPASLIEAGREPSATSSSVLARKPGPSRVAVPAASPVRWCPTRYGHDRQTYPQLPTTPLPQVAHPRPSPVASSFTSSRRRSRRLADGSPQPRCERDWPISELPFTHTDGDKVRQPAISELR